MRMTDLRNDLEPGIHFNTTEAAAHRMTNVVVSAVLEPQG